MYDNVAERISEGSKIVNCGDREVNGTELVQELDASTDGFCYQLYVTNTLLDTSRLIDKIKDLEEVSYMMDVRHVVLCNDRDCVKKLVNADLPHTSVVTQLIESKNG